MFVLCCVALSFFVSERLVYSCSYTLYHIHVRTCTCIYIYIRDQLKTWTILKLSDGFKASQAVLKWA